MSKKKSDEAGRGNSRMRRTWVNSGGLPVLTGIGVFLIYLRTLFPTVGGGDSGELVATACATGVAHPPGYPLFLILAKVFTFFPVGNIAWRVNLLTAICGTGAAVLILLAVRRWTNNQWAGLLSAGLFAFSPLVWRYAIVAEVFSLNHLLLAALLYTAVRYREKQERKFAYLSALLCGLGMSNHHTFLFYGVPIMTWILLEGRRDLWTIRTLLGITGASVLGLAPYLYLPLADAFKPAVSWGNTSTLSGFLTHLLRREYGTLSLGAQRMDATGNFLLGLKEYAVSLPAQLSYFGLPLAAIGLFWSVRQKRNALLFVTVIGFLFYLIVFHALANLPLTDPLYLDVSRRFWPMANLMLCVWAGLGLHALASYVPAGRSRNIEIGLVTLCLVGAACVMNFTYEDQHKNFTFLDYGQELFRPLPTGALVWTRGDHVLNVMRYLRQCEAYRTDVRIFDRDLAKRPWMNRLIAPTAPDVSIPGPFYGPGTNGYGAKQLFDANFPSREIFVRLDEDLFELDQSWNQTYRMTPIGFFRRVDANDIALDPQTYVAESETALPSLDVDRLATYPLGSWENVVFEEYWTTRLVRANFMLNYGMTHDNEPLMLKAATLAFEDLVARRPNSDPFVLKRLGLAYSKLAIRESGYQEKMKSVWKRYLEVAQADDPELVEIKKALSAAE